MNLESFLNSDRVRQFEGASWFYGFDNNQLKKEAWETSTLKILVAFLSPGVTRAVSNTYTALDALIRAVSPDIFVDYSYFPTKNDLPLFKKYDLPLWFGNVSGRPATDYDIVLVSSSILVEFINIFHALDSLKIPRWHKDRLERKDVPLLIAGGIPIADHDAMGGNSGLVDLVYTGYAEGGFQSIVKYLNDECKNGLKIKESKKRVIGRLVKGSNSIYYPDGYEVGYEKERIVGIKPRYDWVPERVTFHQEHDLNKFPGFERKIFCPDNSNATSADLLISAGCAGGGMCAFCMEGVACGGWRERSLDVMMKAMEECKSWTAANTIGFYCVSGKTQVLTEKGTRRIKDLVGKRSEVILTSHGLKGYQKVVESGKKVVYEVETERGYRIECTKSHWFKRYDNALNEYWTKLEDLKVGDSLSLFIPEVKCEVKESADFYIAGLWFGDGSRPNDYNYDVFCNTEERELIANLKRLLGSDLVSEKDCEGNVVRFRINSARTKKIKEVINSKNEGAPDSVWTASVEEKLSFVKGCFDSDGGSSGGTIKFTSVREAFTRDLQRLMLELGMATRIAKVDNTGGFPTKNEFRYDLWINGRESRRRYQKYVGFTESDKSQIIKSKMDKEGGKGRERDIIEIDLKLFRDSYEGVLDSRSLFYVNTKAKGSPFKGRDILFRMCSSLKEPLKGRATYVAESVLFDKIKSIKLINEERTYDVIETETGDFVANGFITHNSFNLNYYSRFIDLIYEASKIFSNLSLINLRTDMVGAAPDYFKACLALGIRRLSMPIEGFGERVRNKILNKSLSFEQIKTAFAAAYQAGLMEIKIGMVLTGHETQADLDNSAEEFEELYRMKEEAQSGAGLRCNITPCVYYPHTGLGWMRQNTSIISLKELKLMKPFLDRLRGKVRFKFNGQHFGTFIEQATLNLGRLGTPIWEKIADTGYAYYTTPGKEVVQIILDELRKRGLEPQKFLDEKPFDHIFPTDMIPKKTHKYNKLMFDAVGKEEIHPCTKTVVREKPKCYDCGYCTTAEMKKSILTRKIWNERTPVDVQESLFANKALYAMRVGFRVPKEYTMIGKEAISFSLAAHMLRQNKTLFNLYHSSHNVSNSPMLRGNLWDWMHGSFYFDIHLKGKGLEGVVDWRSGSMFKDFKSANVFSLVEVPVRERQSENIEVFSLLDIKDMSPSVIQQSLKKFKGKMKVGAKGRVSGNEVLLEERELNEYDIKLWQTRSGVKMLLVLPIWANPYLFICSIMRITYKKVMERASLQVVGYFGQEVATCSCGKSIKMSEIAREAPRQCGYCIVQNLMKS